MEMKRNQSIVRAALNKKNYVGRAPWQMSFQEFCGKRLGEMSKF